MCEPLCYLKFKPNMVISNNDTKYRMKSDNFMYFRLTIHPVHIGDYKRRNKKKDYFSMLPDYLQEKYNTM